MGRKLESLEQKFNKHLNKIEGGCWEWTSKLHQHGYGLIAHGYPNNKDYRAHRVAWNLYYGEIPAGIFVCHKCDNRKCCNPEHLFLGNQSDNMKDAASKGRVKRGVEHHSSTASPELVLEIRKRYDSGQSMKAIHLDLNPPFKYQATVKICKRMRWKHLDNEVQDA
jgi:hypothetical protein